MIYDYKDKEGHVSLWIGQCSNYTVLDNYLSTVFLDEHVEPYQTLRTMFLPDNKNRPCEEELKNAFNNEYYNQFEYDFGLSFDEDFRDANVIDFYTSDLEKLFYKFSYSDSFMDEAKKLVNIQLPACNAAFALYDFKYCGNTLEARHENISLYFLGYVNYKK